MAFRRVYGQNGGTLYDSFCPTFPGNEETNYLHHQSNSYNHNYSYDYYKDYNYNCHSRDFTSGTKSHSLYQDVHKNYWEPNYSLSYFRPQHSSSFKRRKFSDTEWVNCGRHDYQFYLCVNSPTNYSTASASTFTGSTVSKGGSTSGKRGRSELENDDAAVLMSKEEIERCSPSRKDGIDAIRETCLRYSYCAFIQNLGLRLQLPQTTIGTAMVLCHRFFLRRSHACHDRFLIASAALFLAAKSEDTARPLNNVLRASCEIIHKQDPSVLSYVFPIGWYEQYRERLLEAEHLILTTLNFELEVQHPYDPLMSILCKLGLSQTVLVNLALNLVSEGVIHKIRCSPV